MQSHCGRHFVQFHKESGTLAREVGSFLDQGLRQYEGVIVIASESHAKLFRGQLTELGLDPANFEKSGQLKILDAEATLDQFMGLAIPDWGRFRNTIGSVIDEVQGRGFKKIRAYGEMVDILWRKGNSGAAIRLEEYWNDLGQIYDFSLFCAYMLDGLNENSYAGPLHEIGRTHSDVVATEEDDRLQYAIDEASRELWGTPLSHLVTVSESKPGEHRLPVGRRTVLWLKRTMPLKVNEVLERARQQAAQNDFAPAAPRA
jgi:hypothetical protein